MGSRWMSVLAAIALGAGSARAQMLGVPVLQNAFTNAGVTIAGNFASGSGGTRAYGGAAAWSPASAGFQVSAGAGSFDPGVAGSGASFTYGARVMIPVWHYMGDAMGVGVFGGAGGGKVAGVTQTLIPIGLSVGYRRAFGATRAFSLYAVPFYAWSKTSTVTSSSSTGSTTTGTTRGDVYASAGLDVALLPQLGVTAGYQTGGPSWSKGQVGLAVSYALSRVR
ncbi:MAG: hypothetical protein ABJD07_17465 [Gemmatimonadaceae bacterium]